MGARERVPLGTGKSATGNGKGAYQIGERVQLLTHQTSLLPPPCDLAVHEVEEESKRNKTKRKVKICVVVRIVLYAVA